MARCSGVLLEIVDGGFRDFNTANLSSTGNGRLQSSSSYIYFTRP